MDYIAITEVITIPVYEEPKEYNIEQIERVFSPIDSFREEVTPSYMKIRLSEETFKFIQQVAEI